MIRWLLLSLFVSACGARSSVPASGEFLRTTREHAQRLRALYGAPVVHRFLDEVNTLAPVVPREIYEATAGGAYLAAAPWRALPEAERGAWKAITVDEETYYTVRWGSFLSYARPLSVLAEAGLGEVEKLLDFGYGYATHLRLLAHLGVQAHGVDVHPLLPALYSEPGDQGPMGAGSVTLHHGAFPTDAGVVSQIGGDFDVVWSKNVLKRGYIHPEREAKPEQLIDLGVSDLEFVSAVHRLLAPGGYFLIYNLCPPPAAEHEPYIPWADCRCAFDASTFTEAGFEVLHHDVNDDEAIRALARVLEWESPEDLFAMYTLVRRLP